MKTSHLEMTRVGATPDATAVDYMPAGRNRDLRGIGMTATFDAGRYTERCDHVTLRRLLAATDAPFCPNCGEDLHAPPVVSPRSGIPLAPPRRIRPVPRDIDERAVREYVGQAIELNRQRAKREKAAHMDSSTIMPAIAAAMLGVIGDGNSGTKRGWRPVEHDLDPRDCHVDAELSDRYARLAGQALRVTDEVIADQAGVQDIEMPFGSRSHRLTIAQRLALRMASDLQAQKWHEKFASGDAAPALKAAEGEGRRLLAMGAKGWWGR